MHPECRASLSIVEKLIQYYPNSPGPVALTYRARSRAIRGHVPRDRNSRLWSGTAQRLRRLLDLTTSRLDQR
jgi:hypothetical protein